MWPAYPAAQVWVLRPKACESQIHAQNPGKEGSLGKAKEGVWKRLRVGQIQKTWAQVQGTEVTKDRKRRYNKQRLTLTLRASL